MTAQCRTRSAVYAITFAALGSLLCVAGLGCGKTGQREVAALPRLEPSPRAVQGGTAPQYAFSIAPGLLADSSRSIPSELTVYSVVRQKLTRDVMCELAEKVGVSVAPEFRASMPDTVEEPYRRVGLIGELTSDIMAKESNVGPEDKYVAYVAKQVGGITGENLVVLNMTAMDDGNYTLGLRGSDPEPGGEAPTEEEARAIAERFVERSGLLPEGCELGGVSTSASVPAAESGLGDVPEKAVGSQVVYQRYVNGYPGGQFVVQVNGKGEIYYVYRNARNVTPLGSYPILTPEEAVEALSEGRGSITGPTRPGAPLEATVEKIKLCYDQGAAAIPFETLQPSYWIEGSVDGYTDGFHALIPAVRPEYLEAE